MQFTFERYLKTKHLYMPSNSTEYIDFEPTPFVHNNINSVDIMDFGRDDWLVHHYAKNWCCSVSTVWVRIPQREEKKEIVYCKSNSSTVGLKVTLIYYMLHIMFFRKKMICYMILNVASSYFCKIQHRQKIQYITPTVLLPWMLNVLLSLSLNVVNSVRYLHFAHSFTTACSFR